MMAICLVSTILEKPVCLSDPGLCDLVFPLLSPRFPGYVHQVGWWRHLPTLGGQRSKDVLVYR